MPTVSNEWKDSKTKHATNGFLFPLSLGFGEFEKDIEFVINSVSSGKDLYLPDLQQILERHSFGTKLSTFHLSISPIIYLYLLTFCSPFPFRSFGCHDQISSVGSLIYQKCSCRIISQIFSTNRGIYLSSKSILFSYNSFLYIDLYLSVYTLVGGCSQFQSESE